MGYQKLYTNACDDHDRYYMILNASIRKECILYDQFEIFDYYRLLKDTI